MIKIGGIYYYFKRVPKHVQKYDSRTFVKVSLKTKNEEEAKRLDRIYDDYIEDFWRSLIRSGNPDSFDTTYKNAIALARAHGFAYKNATEIAQSSLSEMIQRIEITSQSNTNNEIISAVLGGVDTPHLPLNQCLEKFWPFCADRLTEKSDNQIRKWKNPRIRAMRAFTQVVGEDKDISSLSRKDTLKFRSHLLNLINDKKITGGTANKQFIHVKDVLRTVANAEDIEIEIDDLFKKINFEETKSSRSSFEAKFVQNKILNPRNLANLNREARFLIYVMADSGAREGEIIGLDKDNDIFLNSDIPYIWIRANAHRSIKTAHSDRKIPLVGSALYAFQQMPQGITRYENSDSVSNLINKYLKNNNLRPTDNHTLYSLRHTFKDRLRDVEAPEEIIDELMGHAKVGPKYGRGRTMEQKFKWLNKIAFEVSAL